MSTRSRIAIQNSDGTVESVYCHWDGYVDGLGADLVENYKTEADVRWLLTQGDMSYLGDPYRNRGEDVPSRISSDVQTLIAKMGEDYTYLFLPAQSAWVVYGVEFLGTVPDVIESRRDQV